jgi:hypothetical protein
MRDCADVQTKRINKMRKGGKREDKLRGINGRRIIKKDM